jgi:hypothetical protein
MDDAPPNWDAPPFWVESVEEGTEPSSGIDYYALE